MADCVSVLQANDFLSKDVNRISGRIARSLAINSPWMNVIETGTFESGVSDIQRSIRQEAVAPVLSQAQPNWASFSCTKQPSNIVTGSTEFQYTPLSHFERGPKICVTQAFSAFKNAIRMTEMAITDHVVTLWNSWIRYQLFLHSGQKAVVNSTLGIEQSINQGIIDVSFPPGVQPDSPLTFKYLKALANHLMHVSLAGAEFQWGTGMMRHYRFISDQDTIDAMRNQAEVRSDLRFIAAGGDKYGSDALKTYSWEGPYQGIGFGVDQSIMRVDGVNAQGQVHFVEPFISVPSTIGVRRAVNPAWLNAPYQISFLCGYGSFVREVPEEFLGDGMVRFDKQFWGGKVIWHNQQDNDCNIKGDTGFHYYDLAAAIRPERPEFIIPILHVRCKGDLCLVPCVPQGYYSNSF